MNDRKVQPGSKLFLIAIEAAAAIALFMGWLLWTISSESPSKFIYYNF
jgi:hypothetical protein